MAYIGVIRFEFKNQSWTTVGCKYFTTVEFGAPWYVSFLCAPVRKLCVELVKGLCLCVKICRIKLVRRLLQKLVQKIL